MEQFKIFRETALPSTLEPYAIYLIAPAARPDYVEMYVTDATGENTKRILNQADIEALINTAVADAKKVYVVADITARDALNPDRQIFAYVKDATADPEVDEGGAFYLWDTDSDEWVRTSDSAGGGGGDVSMAWADIVGRPAAPVAQIDEAAAWRHQHTNKTELDKVGEDGEGEFQYDGEYPLTRWESTGW